MTAYQPEQRDIAWIDLNPQAGSEQAGRRPALFLSPKKFNVATGLAWVVPITNQVKGGSFEVCLPAKLGVTGCCLVEQLKSLDWITRRAIFIVRLDQREFDEVLARCAAILGVG